MKSKESKDEEGTIKRLLEVWDSRDRYIDWNAVLVKKKEILRNRTWDTVEKDKEKREKTQIYFKKNLLEYHH